MQPHFLNFCKILGGFSSSLNAKLLNIFLKLFCSAADFQTYFNICLQCEGRTTEGSAPFLFEIMAANQPNFKFLV